jgi:hypothetical protein
MWHKATRNQLTGNGACSIGASCHRGAVSVEWVTGNWPRPAGSTAHPRGFVSLRRVRPRGRERDSAPGSRACRFIRRRDLGTRQISGGERRTDRRAAKAVWILELPGRSGTIHLMHHCLGFACSCHDVKTSGAVHTSFIVKLSANWPTSNCFAVQHDSEYGALYR